MCVKLLLKPIINITVQHAGVLYKSHIKEILKFLLLIAYIKIFSKFNPIYQFSSIELQLHRWMQVMLPILDLWLERSLCPNVVRAPEFESQRRRNFWTVHLKVVEFLHQLESAHAWIVLNFLFYWLKCWSWTTFRKCVIMRIN